MPDDLQRGREAHRRREWDTARTLLLRARTSVPLGVGDLERLAESQYLVGRDEEYLATLETLQAEHLAAGNPEAAARCAFWSALKLMFRGHSGPASGQLARARRLLDQRDCVEQGYLRLAAFEACMANNDAQGAHDAAAEAASIGDRFDDRDLVACAQHLQGKALMIAGRIDAGVPLLDEAMLAVTSGELSPIVTGLIYCNVIDVCQQVYVLARAREWTTALAAWCARQPQCIAFTSTCLVHRAEVLRLQGEWADAIAEARQACARAALTSGGTPPAAAFYQEGEVHRLRGAVDLADDAYRRASLGGRDPQPGLALLRLATGAGDAAAAGIRRALAATTGPLRRARLLPAAVEILIETGAIDEAAAASAELDGIARRFPTPVVAAMAAEARGTTAMATGDSLAALGPLAEARECWLALGAPYPTARLRLKMGLAARALGDEDGARLEFDAAHAAFVALGAAPDVEKVETLRAGQPRPSRLTRRELQVLRLVAQGHSNKTIAASLRLSERTVERHLSNIFTKLDVSSRAGATAHAFRHGLV